MHQPGDEKTLEPSGTLPKPVAQPRVGLLVGKAVEHAGFKAQPRQPQAEIGIFRHIEGVPRPRLAQRGGPEMIGGSTQRQGQAIGRQRRQHHAEERGIFGCEVPGEPVFIGIVEGQLGLQAGQLRWRRCKAADGFQKLVGFRNVLGIIDGHIVATTKGERVVEGARLGLWQACGNQHDLEAVIEHQTCHCPLHGRIGFLEDELDVELFSRISQSPQCPHQLGQNRGLPMQRNQHGIDREFGRKRLSCGHRRRTSARRHETQDAQGDHRQKEQSARDRQSRQNVSRVQPLQGHGQTDKQHHPGNHLTGRETPACGKFRPQAQESEHGLIEQIGPMHAARRRQQVPGRCIGDKTQPPPPRLGQSRLSAGDVEKDTRQAHHGHDLAAQCKSQFIGRQATESVAQCHSAHARQDFSRRPG